MEEPIFGGLKVLDCASYIAGPAAATILSDFGADVIKIEPPGAGDPFRLYANTPGSPQCGHNYGWVLTGRSKRSLALDLGSEAGQAVLRRLVTQADVLVTNFPQPVRRKLKLTYEDLAPLNERLIYAAVSGYGETGPEVAKPGFDSTAWWARSGLMDLMRPEPDATPTRSLPGMGDQPTALALYGAIVTALYRRERTGRGSSVHTSLLGSGLWSNGVFAQARLCGARIERRPAREQTLRPTLCHYRTRDDRWLVITLLNEERQWPLLVDGLGRPDLAEDPRFATAAARQANARALVDLFDALFAARDLAEWRAIFDARGLVFGVVTVMDDILEDQQMRAAGVLTPLENSTMLTIDSPLWIDGIGKRPPQMAPAVGAHGEEVLREAGYDAAEIEELRKAGALG